MRVTFFTLSFSRLSIKEYRDALYKDVIAGSRRHRKSKTPSLSGAGEKEKKDRKEERKAKKEAKEAKLKEKTEAKSKDAKK